MAPLDMDRVSVLLRTRFAEEADAGFPTLRRIPSSGVIKWLDYVETLKANDRESLLDALARTGALRFFHPAMVRERYDHLASDPAFQQYLAAMQSPPFTMGLRYWGIPMRQQILKDAASVEMMKRTRATLDFTPRDDVPETLVTHPDTTNLENPKAPLLRKLID